MTALTVVLAALSLAGAPPAAPAARGCAITGESTDADPVGLRVRAGPGFGSRIVGRLFPGMDPHAFFHDGKATLADSLVGAMFTVDAVSGDWLRVRDIDPVTDGLDPNGGLEIIRNYQGAGWVHSSKVRLIDFGGGGFRAAPGGAAVRPGTGSTLDARIVGCRGTWARLRLDDGSTGWLQSKSNADRVVRIRAAAAADGGDKR